MLNKTESFIYSYTVNFCNVKKLLNSKSSKCALKLKYSEIEANLKIQVQYYGLNIF